VNNDSVTSVTLTSTGTAPTATVASSPYAIVPSAAMGSGLGNYAITYNNGSLTVTTAALTITANNLTKVYGQTATLSGTAFTETGLVNNDSVTSVTLTSTGTAASATVASSPYSIVASSAVGSGLGNYVIKYVSGILTVVNPIVVVHVENASIQKQIAIKGRKRTTTDVIVVQFSGPLEATSAQLLDDFALGTVPKGKKKSKNDVLTKAVYSASAFTVTLTPKRQPLVFKPGVRLTINAPAISSISGQPITGGPVVITLNRIGANVIAPT
jgi:hypothetical protein